MVQHTEHYWPIMRSLQVNWHFSVAFLFIFVYCFDLFVFDRSFVDMNIGCCAAVQVVILEMSLIYGGLTKFIFVYASLIVLKIQSCEDLSVGDDPIPHGRAQWCCCHDVSLWYCTIISFAYIAPLVSRTADWNVFILFKASDSEYNFTLLLMLFSKLFCSFYHFKRHYNVTNWFADLYQPLVLKKLHEKFINSWKHVETWLYCSSNNFVWQVLCIPIIGLHPFKRCQLHCCDYTHG